MYWYVAPASVPLPAAPARIVGAVGTAGPAAVVSCQLVPDTEDAGPARYSVPWYAEIPAPELPASSVSTTRAPASASGSRRCGGRSPGALRRSPDFRRIMIAFTRA